MPATKMRKFRGISLMEALLALGIGGVVISQSIFGLSQYSEGVRIEAAASKLEMLTRATERFSKDNYANLMDAAPAEYSIDVLEPYIASGIGPDAFGNEYRITTRTYTYSAPDPTGTGSVTKSGLQTLLVGMFTDGASETAQDLTLRSEIAGMAGSGAGFISADEMTCTAPDGSVAGDGQICGAYGSFSLSASAFTATNFDDAALVSLVTTGDSAYEEDYLVRYDYGDEELNTMRTDLYMDGNAIRAISQIRLTGTSRISSDTGQMALGSDVDLEGNDLTSVDRISLSGSERRIEANSGGMTFRSAGTIRLEPGRSGASGTNRIQLGRTADDARIPVIGADRNHLQLTDGAGFVRIGDENIVTSSTGAQSHIGTSALGASAVRSGMVRTKGVRALFDDADTRLEVQGQSGGEVIIGKARDGLATASDGTEFEVSDGKLVVGEIQAKNVLCEECVTTSFGDYRWIDMNAYGLQYSASGRTYRNSSDYPIQVMAWSKQDSSDGWSLSVKKIGSSQWLTIHSDTNSGVSNASPIIPGNYDFKIDHAQRAYLLVPNAWGNALAPISAGEIEIDWPW